MYEQIIALINNVGFPVAVSLYLLVCMGDKLDNISKSLDKLTKIIEDAVDK